MPATTLRRSLDEICDAGKETLERLVKPKLRPEDDGKFIAIDIDSGEFELDEDDYTAVARMKARHPGAEIYLARAGYPTAHRIGSAR